MKGQNIDAVAITDIRIVGKNNFFNQFLSFDYVLKHKTSSLGTFDHNIHNI